MTLLTASHHARVVALAGIAKRKGVSSRSSLLIFVKCLWVTLPPLVTTPRQCPLTSLLKEKEIRIKDKRNEWAWKPLHPRQGATHPLQRNPWVSHKFPCYHYTHFPDIPYRVIHSHGLDLNSPKKIPHPMSISPIGCPSVPSKLGLQISIISLMIFSSKRGFMHMFNKLDDYM
jgi:hypothetical protein